MGIITSISKGYLRTKFYKEYKSLSIVPVLLKNKNAQLRAAGHLTKPPEHLCYCTMEKTSMSYLILSV